MSTTAPKIPAPLDPFDADSASADLQRARELLGFTLRAPRRRWRLGALVFLLGVGASVGGVELAPRSYEANAKILAQRNLVMSSLGNPRRAVPNDADAPTRSAGEVIMSRDNLLSIIQEADLLGRWDHERSAVLRYKDAATRAFTGPPSEEDRRRALIGILEKRLRVQSDESTIRISVEWPSPETAYQIVSLAERNFFERRSTVEVAVIADTIEILTAEAERQRGALDTALARVVELRREPYEPAAAARPPLAAPPVAPPPTLVVAPRSPAAPPRAEPQDESNTAARLDEKRAAIRALDEPRQQRLAQLGARLARLQLTYTDAHPAVLQAQAEIKEASVEPAELTELKREERALVARLSEIASPERARRATGGYARPIAAPTAAQGSSLVVDVSPHEDEPELASAKAKLLASTRRYEDLLDRVDSARLELITAQAAFKYRYTVVEPPEVPRDPKGLKGYLLVAGGIVLSVFLAIFAAAARDLGSGRFVEAWQVRRRLGIPVLAEVDKP
jgi:uncharacterized protein involved in exopolysaccharide biosynthesis